MSSKILWNSDEDRRSRCRHACGTKQKEKAIGPNACAFALQIEACERLVATQRPRQRLRPLLRNVVA
eukprot:2122145-Pleurochrysis_carterae.AAC.1